MSKKGEKVKKLLDRYLDEYTKVAGANFFYLPFYDRERIVKLRDNLAQQICELPED